MPVLTPIKTQLRPRPAEATATGPTPVNTFRRDALVCMTHMHMHWMQQLWEEVVKVDAGPSETVDDATATRARGNLEFVGRTAVLAVRQPIIVHI